MTVKTAASDSIGRWQIRLDSDRRPPSVASALAILARSILGPLLGRLRFAGWRNSIAWRRRFRRNPNSGPMVQFAPSSDQQSRRLPASIPAINATVRDLAYWPRNEHQPPYLYPVPAAIRRRNCLPCRAGCGHPAECPVRHRGPDARRLHGHRGASKRADAES